jgi:hypothetical protein
MALVAKGRNYRLIGREVGLSKNTVADIVKLDFPTRRENIERLQGNSGLAAV